MNVEGWKPTSFEGVHDRYTPYNKVKQAASNQNFINTDYQNVARQRIDEYYENRTDQDIKARVDAIQYYGTELYEVKLPEVIPESIYHGRFSQLSPIAQVCKQEYEKKEKIDEIRRMAEAINPQQISLYKKLLHTGQYELLKIIGPWVTPYVIRNKVQELVDIDRIIGDQFLEALNKREETTKPVTTTISTDIFTRSSASFFNYEVPIKPKDIKIIKEIVEGDITKLKQLNVDIKYQPGIVIYYIIKHQTKLHGFIDIESQGAYIEGVYRYLFGTAPTSKRLITMFDQIMMKDISIPELDEAYNTKLQLEIVNAQIYLENVSWDWEMVDIEQFVYHYENIYPIVAPHTRQDEKLYTTIRQQIQASPYIGKIMKDKEAREIFDQIDHSKPCDREMIDKYIKAIKKVEKGFSKSTDMYTLYLILNKDSLSEKSMYNGLQTEQFVNPKSINFISNSRNNQYRQYQQQNYNAYPQQNHNNNNNNRQFSSYPPSSSNQSKFTSNHRPFNNQLPSLPPLPPQVPLPPLPSQQSISSQNPNQNSRSYPKQQYQPFKRFNTNKQSNKHWKWMQSLLSRNNFYQNVQRHRPRYHPRSSRPNQSFANNNNTTHKNNYLPMKLRSGNRLEQPQYNKQKTKTNRRLQLARILQSKFYKEVFGSVMYKKSRLAADIRKEKDPSVVELPVCTPEGTIPVSHVVDSGAHTSVAPIKIANELVREKAGTITHESCNVQFDTIIPGQTITCTCQHLMLTIYDKKMIPKIVKFHILDCDQEYPLLGIDVFKILGIEVNVCTYQNYTDAINSGNKTELTDIANTETAMQHTRKQRLLTAEQDPQRYLSNLPEHQTNNIDHQRYDDYQRYEGYSEALERSYRAEPQSDVTEEFVQPLPNHFQCPFTDPKIPQMQSSAYNEMKHSELICSKINNTKELIQITNVQSRQY